MIDSVMLLAAALVISLTFYALLGGADYGGGVWDLLAAGPTTERQRATIARAIGPVWEANHVWLIVAIVILFSGFPRAFAAVSTYLHIPLLIVLVGIVLRGSAFVFRAYGSSGPRQRQLWGRIFGAASTVTPFFLGVIVGAIVEGRLPARPDGAFASIFIIPWLTTFSLAVGLFTLALCAYLAAVYLTLETRDIEERAAFRSRALASGIIVGVLAAGVLVLAGADLRRELVASSWALPLHVATGSSAVASLVLLWRGGFRLARLTAATQVSLILWGCALAQYPFAIRPHLTLGAAAAPENVRILVLQILAIGAILLLPCLLYLFRLFGPRAGRTLNTP